MQFVLMYISMLDFSKNNIYTSEFANHFILLWWSLKTINRLITLSKCYISKSRFSAQCDGKICMLLPIVNLDFVSSCISNECLPIQLGMLTSVCLMEWEISLHICISVSVFNGMCACVCLWHLQRGLQFLTSCGDVGEPRVPSDKIRPRTHFFYDILCSDNG